MTRLAALVTLAALHHILGVTLTRCAPSMPRGLAERAAGSQEF